MANNIVINFIQSFFGSAGLIVGLFALVGSILLHRRPLQTAVSTVTAILGFCILSVGGGAIATSLNHFQGMFKIVVGGSTSGTVGASDAFAISIMNYASGIAPVASIMLLLAIVFNLLLAANSRFKNIYLSTHIVMYFCVGITAMFLLCGSNLDLGKQGLLVAFIGAGFIALYTTLAPSITTQSTYLLMKDKNMNLCHHGLLCFGMASAFGKIMGKLQKGRHTSIEEVHVPRGLGFLKESNLTIVLVMFLLFVIIYTTAYCIPGHHGDISTLLGGQNLIVAMILDAFMFTAGLLALIMGITMMVNELRDCIKGISQTFIKGAIMSVDASLILKTQPTAVLIGFVSSFIGAIVAMCISFGLHAVDPTLFSTIILPSIVVFFFLGGTAGIFGNIYGGSWGCIVAGFMVGLVASLVPLIFIATWNTFTSATTAAPWYDNVHGWDWHHLSPGQVAPDGVVNNSFGESDYVLIAIFGWLLYPGKFFAIGSLNGMVVVLLIILVGVWTTLIVDGRLKGHRDLIKNPQRFYQYDLSYLNYLSEIYVRNRADKIKMVTELKETYTKSRNRALERVKEKPSDSDSAKLLKINDNFNRKCKKLDIISSKAKMVYDKNILKNKNKQMALKAKYAKYSIASKTV